MTIEKCREMQIACAGRVGQEITDLRATTQRDVAAIREAVQAIDRSVARILGHLGLNGNAAAAMVAPGAHPHHREDEATERLHARLGDVLTAMERRQEEPPPPEPSFKAPRWAVIMGVGLVMLAGIGIVLLVQTKLDVDTIKNVQTLRGAVPQ
jgi:hypothetical protein